MLVYFCAYIDGAKVMLRGGTLEFLFLDFLFNLCVIFIFLAICFLEVAKRKLYLPNKK